MSIVSYRYRILLLIVVTLLLVVIVAACGSIDTSIDHEPNNQETEGEVKATPVANNGGEGSVEAVDSGQSLANISCARCHEMNPEIATWQISSHSKIPCKLCHTVNEDDYTSIHESNDYSRPIKIYKPISDSTCNQCHSMENRNVTPSGDLIIPHSKHANIGVSCVSCHSGIAHANIAQREVTAKGELKNFEKWTPEVAKEVSLLAYSRPSMWTCLNCHKSLDATTDCFACHTEITELPSHEATNWGTAHGIDGRQQPQDCIECHKTPGGETSITPSTGDRVADFARATEFCYSCHTQLPESHKDPWLPAHPSKTIAKGRLNCYTCHDTNQSTTMENATSTYCNECHWFGKYEEPKSAENTSGKDQPS